VYAGYSFAIPANVVRRIVTDIIENGDIERTNLGVMGYDLNPSVVEEYNLDIANGFYIDTVERGSAAQFAGILPGDVIVQIDNKEITNFDDVVDAMKYNKVGDQLKIKVNRNGGTKTIKVKLRKGL